MWKPALGFASQKGLQMSYTLELESHRKYLLGVARKMLRNTDQAEDLVQDTFMLAIRAINRFDGGNMGGWLYTIMRNHYYSGQRYIKSRSNVFIETDPDKAALFAYEPAQQDLPLVIRDFDKAMSKLSKRQRICLDTVNDDLSYDEAAAKLGLPAGTVKSSVHRARKILQEETA